MSRDITLAEEEGFEPSDPCRSTVFKTVAFGRSATLPMRWPTLAERQTGAGEKRVGDKQVTPRPAGAGYVTAPAMGKNGRMSTPHFLTVCGSLRSGSYNAALLRTAEAEFTRLGISFERHDAIRDIPHFDQDLESEPPAVVTELREKVTAADGVLFVTPAYNGAVTGVLKDWIDWSSRPIGKGVLATKHIGIITASIGPNGGSQAAEYLERIGRAFKANVVSPILSVPSVQTTLDEASVPNDAVTALVNEVAQALVLSARGAEVFDNVAKERYELHIDGIVTGYSNYIVESVGDLSVVELPHTVTERPNGGQGMASFLTRSILDRIAATESQRVLPSCHFVADYIHAHPKYQHLLAS